MKRLFLYFCLILMIAVSGSAQQPSSTPPSDDQVVKINTNLIQIDVTVVDKNGKVVPGLAASDFQLFENGQLQKISNFLFVSKTAAGATVSNQELKPGEYALEVTVSDPVTKQSQKQLFAFQIN